MGNTISGGSGLSERDKSKSTTPQRQTVPPPTAPSHDATPQANRPTRTFAEYKWSQLTDAEKEYFKRASSSSMHTRDTPLSMGVLFFTFGIFLTGALAAKALSSSHRARQAEHSARAWERVCLGVLEKKSSGSLSRPAPFSRVHDYEARHKGSHDGSWGKEKYRPVAEPTPTSSSSSSEAVKAQVIPAPAKTQATSSPSNLNKTTTASDKSLYSAIHPHEDWDWVPADHPRPHRPWKKSRLPPWTVGFTSTPRAQETVQQETNQREVGIPAESQEDRLLRSAIWPSSESSNASEATLIADEVFKDLTKGAPIKAETRKIKEEVKVEKPRSSNGELELFRTLERQMWALLARSQALEDKLRRYESRSHFR